MKKSLVLAMAMALGVTASAYAANPFSDVPAGHWAYDSVAKLAAAGVVDGYAWQARCELKGWKKTQGALATADAFIFSWLVQYSSVQHNYTQLFRAFPGEAYTSIPHKVVHGQVSTS